jgi:hypothetical protein
MSGNFFSNIVVVGQLCRLLVFFFYILKDCVKTRAFLTFEETCESVFKSVIQIGVHVVHVAIANHTILGFLKDFAIFFVKVQYIASSPYLNIVNDSTSFGVNVIVHSLQDLHAVEANGTTKTVTNQRYCSIGGKRRLS